MPVLPAAAVVAVVVVMAAIAAMLARSEPYTLPQRPKPLGRHELAAATDPYRPRPYDEVMAAAPISAPPAVEEPIDELDPRWDWQAYLAAQETDERELVPA